MDIRTSLFLLFASAVILSPPFAPNAPKDPNSYDALAERARNKGQTQGFRQLHFAYAGLKDPKPDAGPAAAALFMALAKSLLLNASITSNMLPTAN